MSVISLLGAKGAPGVTTTALGLALTWPRPCLLVEADVSGSSSILAGHLRGVRSHDRSVLDLLIAHRRGGLDAALHDCAIPLGENGRAAFVPALSARGQAPALSSFWPVLLGRLRDLEEAGTDVLVDTGRIGDDGFPLPLVLGSNAALLLTRSDLPALAATRSAVVQLHEALETAGVTNDLLHLLVVGEGQPYGTREITRTVGAPSIGSLPWAPKDARVFSHGGPPPRRFARSSFLASLHNTGTAVRDGIARRDDDQAQAMAGRGSRTKEEAHHG